MISFKGAHYPKTVIMYTVYFYVRFGVSYRDLEEIMAERGVLVDHATLNRWMVKYAPEVAGAQWHEQRSLELAASLKNGAPADFVVDTDGKSIVDVANEIVSKVSRQL